MVQAVQQRKNIPSLSVISQEQAGRQCSMQKGRQQQEEILQVAGGGGLILETASHLQPHWGMVAGGSPVSPSSPPMGQEEQTT